MTYSADVPAGRSPVRFTVGTDRGPRSAVWRIWSQGDETYVAARERADKKTSLHSGRRFYQDDRPPWSRPRPFAPDATDLYRIWIPTPELTVPKEEPDEEEAAKVVLVEAAPAEGMSVVSVVQTSKEVGLGPPSDMPSLLLAHWSLRRRSNVWVVVTHQPYLDEDKRLVARGKAEGWKVEGPGFAQVVEEEAHARMVLWVNEDGERYGAVDVSPHREETGDLEP